jgi:hypothetical protein
MVIVDFPEAVMILERGYPRLRTFLKNELPNIAKNKKIMNAYIWTVASRGGFRIPKGVNDPAWTSARHLAPQALAWGRAPTAAVGTYVDKDNSVTSAVFDADNNTVTFDEQLVEGLEAAPHAAGSMVYEMVAMHELTHWLDFNVNGVAFTSGGGAELGSVFELMAYTKVERAMRNSLIGRVRAGMKALRASDG